ncbi:ArsR/SmtB family transcription factor [Chelatococcus daeguensis]|nr:metalloregulator ArsR/SmtB family transcription factor [Chelatococcus daeguensis]
MSRPEMRAPDAVPIFAALGDPTRAGILRRLAREGRLSLTQLARGAPITRQAVSRHVAVLEAAGLVAARRHGRELQLTLRPAPLAEAANWLAEVGAAWDGALDRLARQVEEDEG